MTVARLGRSFFDRPTRIVARQLIGCELWTRGPGVERGVRIVETEAYVGRDEANHANRGMTRRNRSMFGAPGTLYVYCIHRVVCANVVTRPGQAVLIRAGEPLGGTRELWAGGPGRLCRALGITIADDGTDAAAGARIRFRPRRRRPRAIVSGPRIGISRAVERPLRFAEAGSRYVSSPRPWAGSAGKRPTSA